MNVWIVNPYGALPTEGWRKYRSLMLAEALVRRGHNVTWWVSDFIHRSKVYRDESVYALQPVDKNINIVGVHSTPYYKNISISRVLYERNFSKAFGRTAKKKIPPDIIVLAEPSLFYSQNIVAFAESVECKLIIDVIDLWPELFSVVLPKPFKRFEKFIFYPFYRRRDMLVSKSHGVVAVTKDYLKAVTKSCDPKNIHRLVSYWGVDISEFNREVLNFPDSAIAAKEFINQADLTVIYAGTLGDAYDMEIIGKTIKVIANENLPIRFIVAGDGPRRAYLEQLALDYPSIILFMGTLPASHLAAIYNLCDVGLISYVPGSTVSMPIKLYDYCASGLAIMSSLEREISSVIENNKIGQNYKAGDSNDLLGKLKLYIENPDLLQMYKNNSLHTSNIYDSKIQHDNFANFIELVCEVQ